MDNIKLENIKTTDNTVKYKSVKSNRYKKKDEPHLTSVTVKIGLCIAICVTLCIINIATGSRDSVFTSSEDDSESPGKLRFVELPGIIEVFAGGDKLTMPLGEYSNAELDEETYILTLKSKSNATVVTCSGGTVKAVGEDSKFGNYVVIRSGDIETYYYGLGYVTVEERQVINKLDTLGLLTHTGIMHFKICESGKPQNPCDYLPLKLKK